MSIRLLRNAVINGVSQPQSSRHDLTAAEEFWYVAIGAAEYVVLPDSVREVYPLLGSVNSVGQVDSHFGGPDGSEYLPWDDLRFPAQGINPAGQTSAPDIDTSTFPGTLLFDSSSAELIAGIAQMPHAWARSSEIRPHIHWAKTTSASGGVVWDLSYTIASVGGTFGAYSDWDSATDSVSDSDTAGKHALAAFSPIDMSGYKESCIIIWQIRRNPADASDTYAADARFLEFDIHFQVAKGGTVNEIPS